MDEQRLYEDAMKLLEDVEGFMPVEEPIKFFGLRKYKGSKKGIQKKIEVFGFNIDTVLGYGHIPGQYSYFY